MARREPYRLSNESLSAVDGLVVELFAKMMHVPGKVPVATLLHIVTQE